MQGPIDVIVSGLNVVDLLVSLPEQVQYGSKQQVERLLIQGGAPAGNAACAMAGLGLNTAFLGYTSEHTLSVIAEKELQRCGVDTSLMLASDTNPAIALVEVDPKNGERTVFYSLEGYQALAPKDINRQWVEQARLVFVDGYDIETNLALLQLAKECQTPSVLDLEAGDEDQLKEMIKLGQHIILPLEAAQHLSHEQNAKACLHALSEITNGQLLITDGANGSWALDGKQVLFQPAFKVNVVDTTGCGDAYHGAYAAALLNQYSLIERMQFAAAYAAMIAEHFGGRSFHPDTAAVKQFIQNSVL